MDKDCLNYIDIYKEWLPNLHTKEENDRYYHCLNNMPDMRISEFFNMILNG